VQCRQCAHRFEVTSPPAEAVPATVPAGPADAAAPKPLTPPPLPARVVKDRPAPPARGWEVSKGDPDIEPEVGEKRPRRRPIQRERPGSTGALVGLAAAFLLGLFVLVGGVTYLLWPGASKATSPAVQGAAPAVEAPVTAEPPKRFEDIIREAPRRDGGPGVQPGMPNFNPPPPMPPFPRPRGGQVFPGAGGAPAPAADGPKFAAVIPLPTGSKSRSAGRSIRRRRPAAAGFCCSTSHG
jgi:hypothetical protein